MIVIGVGAYLIAAAATGSSSPAVATSPPPNGRDGAAPPFFGGSREPHGLGRPLAVGVVQHVGSSSFTLLARAGTVTVDTTSQTTYAGLVGGRSALAAGARAAVFGTQVSSTTIDATRVLIGDPGGPGRFAGRPRVFGKIQSIATSSFTISALDGSTATVDVDSHTTYSDGAKVLPGLSALKAGADVIVVGSRSGSTVQASAVRVVTPGAGGLGGRGLGGDFGAGAGAIG